MKTCKNPFCQDAITDGHFCYSCRHMGKCGMFVGGIIVGAAVALLKFFKLL